MKFRWTIALLSVLVLAAVHPAHAVSESVLYTFNGAGDGTNPFGGVILYKGKLYGLTSLGGAFGSGAIYKVSKSGGEVVLYSFNGGSDGGLPQESLVADASGNLYGANCAGGTSNAGTVFKLSPTNVFKVLHNFKGGLDGSCPTGSMVVDTAGNVYGTAFRGGASNAGTVFKLSSSGTFMLIYAFKGGSDGLNPLGGIARSSTGNIFGTTANGGKFNHGTIYKVSATGVHDIWWSFTGGVDGRNATPGVSLHNGYVYGTTTNGGRFDAGTVFAARKNLLSTLYSFTGLSDGGMPESGGVFDGLRNFWGATSQGGANFLGTVYKVALGPPATHSIIYSFSLGPDGYHPFGRVIFKNGIVYGTTPEGGDPSCSSNGCGTVYQVVP
jgi:uncharacterized repeat protein (TIGR03803 family)